MSEPRSFAYSLAQAEDGWRWRIYDEDGVTVADGSHPTQAAALAEVHTMLESAGVDLAA
ncbi:MAG: hypothetical protein JF588_19650 [Caulobacterales bacterium]|nr:hypothetical protein [Caulobacterales bacterium]